MKFRSGWMVVLIAGASLTAGAQVQGLRIMAPAAPGGGWDQTSRAMQQVLQDTKLASGIQVTNVPGAGGTIGLAQLVNQKGDGNQLMMMGLVMVGAIQTNKSKVTLDQVTPIARLTTESLVMVVPSASPVQNFQDFVKAWKADPAKQPIAGGSAGGSDHILVGLLAQANGVEISKVNYVPFAGGGEAVAALLGNQVAAGVSGYGEFEAQIKAGKLRAIGISSRQRNPNIPVATFFEQGTRVDMGNWRGVVAPLGIPEARRRELIDLVTKMRNSAEWKAVLAQRNWQDAFMPGAQFEVFLKLENERIVGTLRSIGLIK